MLITDTNPVLLQQIFDDEVEQLPDWVSIRYHHHLNGRVDVYSDGDVLMSVPQPTSLLKLGICFHELGHIVLGHQYPDVLLEDIGEPYSEKRYKIEVEACRFAIDKMREYNLCYAEVDDLQQKYLQHLENTRLIFGF